MESKPQQVVLQWTRDSRDWKDESEICTVHLEGAPLLRELSEGKHLLKELPWRRILIHTLSSAASQTNIATDDKDLVGSIVQTAALDTLAALRKFLEDWADSSARVWSTVNWEYSAKELCEKSRPGAFLSDCMVTEAMVRKGARKNVHCHVAYNNTFQTITQSSPMTKSMNANNAGNVLEALCWVALEEGKPLWTVALAWHVLRLQGMPQSDSPNWAPGAPFHSDTAAASASCDAADAINPWRDVR